MASRGGTEAGEDRRRHRRRQVDTDAAASPSTSLEVLVSCLHNYRSSTSIMLPSQLLSRLPTHISWSTNSFGVLVVTLGSWETWSTDNDEMIKQVVVLKGQVFGTDNGRRLFIVYLGPHIRIQEIAVDWGDKMMIGKHDSRMCLVACANMLLMVCSPCRSTGDDTVEAFRLGLSAEPAKWVNVEKLENWAIFISTDRRSQPLCCMDPERWGGRSNCIYCYDSEEWIACELGKPLQEGSSIPSFTRGCMMQPMWVVPSMFYPCP